MPYDDEYERPMRRTDRKQRGRSQRGSADARTNTSSRGRTDTRTSTRTRKAARASAHEAGIPTRGNGDDGSGGESRKRTLRTIALVLLALIVAATAYGIYRYQRIIDRLEPAESEVLDEVRDAVDPIERNEPLYVLVLGVDARPGETRARADTIILARIDAETGRIAMLSIPRDSRVEIEGHGLDKMGHATFFGGPALAISTVKTFTGLPVHHYVQLDFEGFTGIVDAVGGVTVNVERAINDRQAGSETGVTRIPAGVQTLNAAQSLTFVRSRAYADGDFTRIKNQQRFLIALAKQALSGENLTRLPSIAEAAAENVQTDMPMTRLMSLAMSFRSMSEDDMVGYTIPATTGTIGGVSYVLPDTEEAAVLFGQFREGSVPTEE